ncbi:MAG: helical backbone metal receptor [Wenzhouxiangella sp.]
MGGLSTVAKSALADPPRVIALAPHLAELVFAAGAGEALVGTVAWSDYPAEAAALPVIGDAFRLDLERILGLDPELALAWDGGTPPAAAERLSELGIEVLWIRTRTLAEIAEALRVLGARLGSVEPAEIAAQAFLDALAERSPAATDALVPAFYQVSERPLFTLGARHIINEVLGRCGLGNIFADLDLEAAAVDFEAVLARRPEVIVISQETGNANPISRWQRAQAQLPATVQFIAVDPTTLIRPSPRIVEGLDELCSALSREPN